MTVTSKLPIFGRKLNKFFVVALLAVATGCAQIDPGKRPSDSLVFLDTDMESLPGWNNDKVLNALPALQKSCRLVLKKLNRRNKSQETLKKYSDWQKSCDQITANNFNENTFREFLKRNFNAYQIRYLGSDEGLFTGYYEPTLYGSLKPSREYKTPIYPKPTDLIHVNLGEWKSSLDNSRILGRVVGHKLKAIFFKI